MAQLLTGRASVIADRQVELLTPFIGNAGFCTPAIQGVVYGDQDKIPAAPYVCIEPNTKDRDWPPTPTDMTDIILETYIYIYHADVASGNQTTRRECDKVAETIEEYFNVNHRQLRNAAGDDLVIYGYVIKNESGTANKGQRTMLRVARLTWRGRSKLRLTQAQ